jgi:hypothetical protein
LGPRLHNPLHYTLDHLAEKILHSKATLEGKRMQVIVLFADLKGLLELLADRMLLLVNYDPEYQHCWGNQTYSGFTRAKGTCALKAPGHQRKLLVDLPYRLAHRYGAALRGRSFLTALPMSQPFL